MFEAPLIYQDDFWDDDTEYVSYWHEVAMAFYIAVVLAYPAGWGLFEIFRMAASYVF